MSTTATRAPVEAPRRGLLTGRPTSRPARPARAVRHRRLAWAAAALLAVVTLVALVGPLVAPDDPLAPIGIPNQPPGTAGALLGTDSIGRDLLSRTLYGVRTSWLVSLATVAVGLVVGGGVGLLAGATGGRVDAVLMRTTDLFLSLPATLVAIAVVAALGPGLLNTFLAISLVWWPFYARIVRGEVRALAARPHVEAARLAGAGGLRVALRHLLPGVVPSAVVTASLDVGNVVLTLAALSFLGLGQPAPAAELGADTARTLAVLLQYWWVPVVPGLGVLALSLAANVGGDGVRALLAGRR